MVALGQTVLGATGQGLFGDWHNYRDSVVRIAEGGALYEPKQLAGPYFMPDTVDMGYSYTPGSIPWLAPFSSASFGSAAWTAVTVGFFLVGLWAALRRDLGSRAVIPFALALFGLIVYLPFGSAVLSGNVNLFFVSTYAWCWALGRAEPRVGVLAAIGGLFKVFPSVLVLWPTGRSRWRSIALAVAVVVGSSLVALPFVGLQAFLDFPSVVLNAQPFCADVRVSIPCALTPVLGITAAKAVAIGLALVALLGALLVRNDRAAFVLFGVAMVAPVSDMHLSYWLFAYVAGVVLVGGLLHRKWRGRMVATGDSVLVRESARGG